MNIILGRQTWNMHACGYICDHVCASAAHYSHSFLQTSFSPFSLPQKNSDTHCLFHFHCLCRTNKPPPLPPPPPPPHTHTHTPPPAKTHTFLWRCFSLIVIQQHHQLLGLVYETPVQLATKHTVCIAFHSGHWYLRFFFFLVALSWMKVASVYISSRQWRAGPPPPLPPSPPPSCEGSFSVQIVTLHVVLLQFLALNDELSSMKTYF